MKAIYRSSATRQGEFEVSNRQGEKCDLKNAKGEIVVTDCKITDDEKSGTCSLINESEKSKSARRKEAEIVAAKNPNGDGWDPVVKIVSTD